MVRRCALGNPADTGAPLLVLVLLVFMMAVSIAVMITISRYHDARWTVRVRIRHKYDVTYFRFSYLFCPKKHENKYYLFFLYLHAIAPNEDTLYGKSNIQL